MQDFDFLIEEPQEIATKAPEVYAGPNLAQVVKMTRKGFGDSILRVYDKLGGDDWLFQEAQADPKAYLQLLAKMVPKQTVASELGDLTVKLINRFGDSISIETTQSPAADGSHDSPGPGEPDQSRNTPAKQAGSGSNETATSGNPNSPTPKLIERY